MSRSVFIFGAGASVDAGAPVMYNFIDQAEELLSRNIQAIDSSAFKKVLEAISAMQVVHSKSQFDLINLESVFTGLEMARILRKDLPRLNAGDLEDVIKALKILIAQTLEQSISFPMKDKLGVQPTGTYLSFAKTIIEPISDKSQTAILSFNYDIAQDFSFTYQNMAFNYCLDGYDSQAKLLLLKLHGSLNWIYDKTQKKVIAFPMEKVVSKLNPIFGSDTSSRTIPISRHLHQLIGEARADADSTAYIVPPSWNKGEHQQSLTNVWNAASCVLEQAENIFIIGFSLPDTDTFFRNLYAFGCAGETRLKRFWVFNPDHNVEPKFKALLGPGAEPRFRFFPEYFRSAVETLKKEFVAKLP